ncbi:MAG: hypothetical protein BKP49_11085 [Treponema sp. CETP13]|nr:MAG: hypothetical protein BKP49_11085 [Treponema sp. CETP13]
MEKNTNKKDTIKKVGTAIMLVTFIVIGSIDALLQNQVTFSSIMGLDITRVYFYTFFLIIIGCWLLYNHFLVGIGFISLAAFSSYFPEYLFLHNYFASIMIYIGLLLDIICRRKPLWLIPFIVLGLIQGIAFQNLHFINYVVGSMELMSLCIGSIFVVKNI